MLNCHNSLLCLPQSIIDGLIEDPDSEWETITHADVNQWIEWTKGSRSFFIALVVGLIFTCLMTVIGLFWCFARCCCGCGKGGKKKSGDAFTQSWFFMIFIILYYSIIHVPKTHVLVQMAQQLKQTLDHNECCSAPSPLSVPASNLCERHTFVKHKKEQ